MITSTTDHIRALCSKQGGVHDGGDDSTSNCVSNTSNSGGDGADDNINSINIVFDHWSLIGNI